MNSELDKIDQYLSGLLDEQSQDEFEARLIIDSSLQQQVTQQMALRQAMKEEVDLLVGKSETEPRLSSRPEPSLLRRVCYWLTSPAWAYSATAMLVALTVATLLPEQSQTVVPTGQFEARVAVVRDLELSRSGKQVTVIPAIKSGEAVVLSIDAYGLGLTSADFSLTQEGKQLIHLPSLSPNADELIIVNINPLAPGKYQIEMTAPDVNLIQFALTVNE